MLMIEIALVRTLLKHVKCVHVYQSESLQHVQSWCVMWCSIAANHKETKNPPASPSSTCSPPEQGTAKKKTKSSNAQAKLKQHDADPVCII